MNWKDKLGELLGKTARFGVGLAVVLAPWMFGAYHAWAYLLLCMIVMVSVGCWLLQFIFKFRKELHFPVTTMAILLLFVYGIFQIIPLPSPWVEELNPKSAEVQRERIECFQEMEMSEFLPDEKTDSLKYMTISAAPGSTSHSLLILASMFGVFLVEVNCFRNWSQIKKLLMALVVSGFLMSVLGIVHEFSNSGLVLWFHKTDHGGAIFGPFANPNHYAFFMNLLFGLALGFFLVESRRIFKGDVERWHSKWEFISSGKGNWIVFLGFAVAVMGASVFVSLSRGGIVCLMASVSAVTLWFAIKVKEKGGALQIAGVVFLVLAVVIWLGWRPVTAELSTLLDLGNASRSRPDAAISTLEMHEDYPLLGSGFGSFEHVFPSYQGPSIQSGRWTHAHNDYVELLANGGIVGFIIILGVIVSFFREIKRGYHRIPDRSKFLIGGASTGLGAAFLHSFIGFGFRSPASALLFMTVVGLCIASTRRLRSRKSGHKRERKRDLEFIPGSRGGITILRGAAILGFFSVLVILWICISDFRGAMAYSRVLLYKRAAEKAKTAEYFNLQASLGLKDTEILLQHGSGMPDNLREASIVCLNWAADDRIRNLNMQFQLIERSVALSAIALKSAPSDYLIWKQLARAQAALGLPEKARIALHRARELAPPGKVVEFPSLTSK